MAKQFNILNNPKNKRFFLNYILFIILILFPLQKCEYGNCNSNSNISDTSTCFNQIIKFSLYDRAGQITMRNDGILLIEYSNAGDRIFYGLKTNGRGYFQNEATIKRVNNLPQKSTPAGNTNGRFESKNILVSFFGAPRSTQYILSISSYHSISELHDIDHDDYQVWSTAHFLNFTNTSKYFFSHQFSLIEKKDENIYFAAYVQYRETNDKNEAYSVSYTLSRIKFTDLNNYEILTKEFDGNYDNRIVSAFYMDKYSPKLIVFFLKSGPATYYYRVHDIETLAQDKEIYVEKIAYDDGTDNANPGYGIFFKAIYLQHEYAALIYFKTTDGKTLKLKIIYIKNDYNIDHYYEKQINSYSFDTGIKMNEFYKIDEQKLLFVSTISKQTLVLMFIDTFDWYKHMKIRTYKFGLDGYKFNMEFSV